MGTLDNVGGFGCRAKVVSWNYDDNRGRRTINVWLPSFGDGVWEAGEGIEANCICQLKKFQTTLHVAQCRTHRL